MTKGPRKAPTTTPTHAPTLTLEGHARINGTAVFRDMALRVLAGRWTCLLGPSGVGKSTILRLFAGLAPEVTFEGRIWADAWEGEGMQNGTLVGRVALMAQDDLLLPWLDVRGNVVLGARLRGAPPDLTRAAQVMEQVGLGGLENRRPCQLSGGQRQRAALARTLMEDRPVVLLDEPFSALDARTRTQMQDLTVATLAGRTVLLVTHDPAEATRLGHQIVVMTETGVQTVPPPPGTVPRPYGDPATLRAQAHLFALLNEAPKCPRQTA